MSIVQMVKNGLFLALVVLASPTMAQVASQNNTMVADIADAFAQELQLSRVVSDGVGTVYIPPSHVVFWMHFTLPEGDLRTGIAAAEPLAGELREAFSDKEIRPSLVTPYAPHIVSLAESSSELSIEVRFSMAGLVGAPIGTGKFAALCEEMKALGGAFSCRVSDPTLIIADENVTIQEAVREATKEAYIGASGASDALGATIRDVEEVRVHEIVWNAPPKSEVAYPTIEFIACSARVTVTYRLQ